MRTAIETDGAAAAIGPYSQAVRVGPLLFVSGQIPLDPATGHLVDGDIGVQTDRVMRSIGAILEAAGATFAHVVRTTVYLTDLGDFPAMNEVYGTYFLTPAPARSTVQVSGLPKGARVEIEVVASVPA
jgi:2-iminobutanoate/2-iminopropanoate deaminase